MVEQIDRSPAPEPGKNKKPFREVKPQTPELHPTELLKLPTLPKEGTIVEFPKKQPQEEQSPERPIEKLADFFNNLAADLDGPTETQEKISRTQKIKNKILEKKLSLTEKIKKPLIGLGAMIFVPLVDRNIVRQVEPEYSKGFDDAYMELAKDPNVLFILMSNHTGHADVAGTAAITKHSTKLENKVRPRNNRSRGYMLTVAASLDSGHQSMLLQQCIRRAEKILKKRYFLSLEAFARKKDIDKYQIPSRVNLKYAQETRKIVERNDERKADNLAFYVEATVEGGRLIKEGENAGKRKGTQEIDFEPYDDLIRNRMQTRNHRKVAIITCSQDGASEIFDPELGENIRPTRETVMAIANPIRAKKSMLKVKVDMPILYDDFIQQLALKLRHQPTIKEIGDEIGRRISSGVPVEKRGYYK